MAGFKVNTSSQKGKSIGRMDDQWITCTFHHKSGIRQESKAHLKINTEIKATGIHITDQYDNRKPNYSFF